MRTSDIILQNQNQQTAGKSFQMHVNSENQAARRRNCLYIVKLQDNYRPPSGIFSLSISSNPTVCNHQYARCNL
jgi:hypothetical protein